MSNRDLLKNCLQKLEQMQNQMANQAILIQEQKQKFAVFRARFLRKISKKREP